MAVAHWLELWRHDALLHGELCLKHCCILEAGAESRDPPGTVDNIPVTFMAHDRAKLLECRRNLEQTETFIKQAREQAMRVEGGRRPGETVVTFSEDDDQIADLAIVHAECVYALTRVQVKLAAASPPPGKENIYFYYSGASTYSGYINLCINLLSLFDPKMCGEKFSKPKIYTDSTVAKI